MAGKQKENGGVFQEAANQSKIGFTLTPPEDSGHSRFGDDKKRDFIKTTAAAIREEIQPGRGRRRPKLKPHCQSFLGRGSLHRTSLSDRLQAENRRADSEKTRRQQQGPFFTDTQRTRNRLNRKGIRDTYSTTATS